MATVAPEDIHIDIVRPPTPITPARPPLQPLPINPTPLRRLALSYSNNDTPKGFLAFLLFCIGVGIGMMLKKCS